MGLFSLSRFLAKGLPIPLTVPAVLTISEPAAKIPTPTTAIPARPCRTGRATGNATGAAKSEPPTIVTGFDKFILNISSLRLANPDFSQKAIQLKNSSLLVLNKKANRKHNFSSPRTISSNTKWTNTTQLFFFPNEENRI
jgi:hypothetical protein